jgi:hypothetical protein
MGQEQKPFAYRVKAEGHSKVFQTLKELVSALKSDHVLVEYVKVFACYSSGKEELVPRDKYAEQRNITEEEALLLVKGYKATYENLKNGPMRHFFYDVMSSVFNPEDPEEKQVKDFIKNRPIEWLKLEDIVS